MPLPQRLAVAVVLTILVAGMAAGSGIAGLPAGDTVSRLSGRWAGPGTVVLQRGPSEAFKCVITYLPGTDGARVQQNLRCSNESYKLDASTHLQFNGNAVTGRWSENNHNLDGLVSGTLTPTGFEIELAGRFFQASMSVAGDGCAQAVKVTPVRGGDNIREISATLRKC